MGIDDEEITWLFCIRRTLMQMLRDRNYLVEDCEINMTKQQFIDANHAQKMRKYPTTLYFTAAKRNDDSDQKICVFFSAEKDSSGVDKMLRPSMKAIVVFKEKLPNINKLRRQCGAEIFQEEELLVNVTEHALVPKHEVLTEEEKKALLEFYNISDSQLPWIRTTDPIARYYGLRRGQVVKITRHSELEGQSVIYRCCSHS
ncbi:DNA-directed RNA polymerases II and IV subunit 5A isoform X1 [Cannabis sativa]|uniref:DNA-directed RNA polymerases II and IV subunit 5A isoform X1 n=1 Tax=Cannabis sativa TaxID=3483 RepID=UPI0029C9C616|nr:DNA-directed RNA polymerases II and IV subunit 5A isoform X1 [Cannabis sativa]